MALPPPDDPQWQRLRRAFEDVVDLDPDARERAIREGGFAPGLLDNLRHLLRVDSESQQFLVPGQPICLPAAVDDDDGDDDGNVAGNVAASHDDVDCDSADLDGADLDDSALDQTSLPRTLGRYVLRERIGKGGMGEVFVAHDPSLDRSVAIKLLAGALSADAQWLARFRVEARAAGSLNHPNVLTVHDVGTIDGTPYLATELVIGETLRDRLARGPVPIRDALHITKQIASALAAAHAVGIVHRDLKPENVMLRADGWVKVLDFGLAKITARAELPSDELAPTASGVLLGSMHYMSPEQARGLTIDGGSDVFSLGVVLYEMLTGRVPFRGATPLDVLVALLEHEPTPLEHLRPETPAALRSVVARALQKDRAARYGDAAALCRALEAIDLERAPSPAAGSVPEVRYATSGEVDIAYQVIGSGPIDLVFVMGWISHLDYFWREPSFARFLRRLASFARVILFDKRGTGLSDRVPTDRLPTLEQRMDDVRAVLDAVGSERAVLCGISEGGPMCGLFAATYPQKTVALIMIGSYARRLRCDDYPLGISADDHRRFLEQIRAGWGGPVGIAARAPSKADDPAFREWWAAYLQNGASPSAALALTRMNAEIDVRHVLPSVRVPTLVVHRVGDVCLRVEEGRFLAQQIEGARLVELPGVDHLPFVGDQDAILESIERFLGELRPSESIDRVLATVLIAELAGDAEARARFGVAVSGDDHTRGRRTLEFGHDSLIASFAGPARAIRAATAMVDLGARHGVRVRVGLHTGECDTSERSVRGVAVDLARAVTAIARFGDVVVSHTVRDLVAGSGLRFVERDTPITTEVIGMLRLFEVVRERTV